VIDEFDHALDGIVKVEVSPDWQEAYTGYLSGSHSEIAGDMFDNGPIHHHTFLTYNQATNDFEIIP